MLADDVEALGVEHGPVHAQAHVAAAGRHHAAEARPVPAGHAGLERELRRHRACRAQRAHRLEHGRRPAGVHRGGRRAGVRQLRGQQVGDEPLPAGGAVVGGDPGVA
jgi:hypothetical protein